MIDQGDIDIGLEADLEGRISVCSRQHFSAGVMEPPTHQLSHKTGIVGNQNEQPMRIHAPRA